MKNARHRKILELIDAHRIDRQEELLACLKKEGFSVTQATVSRDMRELGLVKLADEDGRYRYAAPEKVSKGGHTATRFETIFRESVIGVDYAGHTVLVKCYTGMANAACEVFDHTKWEHIVGTLAGDDTFLVLLRTPEAAKQLCEKLRTEIEGR